MPTTTKKTSLELPLELWSEAKKRAVDEQCDLRDVIIRALLAYLKTKPRKGGNDAHAAR